MTENSLKNDIVEETEVKGDIERVPIARLIALTHFKKIKEGFTSREFSDLTFSNVTRTCSALKYYKQKKGWIDKIRVGSKSMYYVTELFPVDDAIKTIKIGQRVKDSMTLRCIQKLIELQAKKNGNG